MNLSSPHQSWSATKTNSTLGQFYHYLRRIPIHHPFVFWATRSHHKPLRRRRATDPSHFEGRKTRNRERPSWTRWRLPVVWSWLNRKVCQVRSALFLNFRRLTRSGALCPLLFQPRVHSSGQESLSFHQSIKPLKNEEKKLPNNYPHLDIGCWPP